MLKKSAVLLIVLVMVLLVFPFSTVRAERAETAHQRGSIYDQLMQGEKIVPPPTSNYNHPQQPTVYLTFDDGPSKLTPAVLDILKQEQVPATFFVLGKLAERSPDVVRRILEEGHTLGNHTYNHEYSELYSDFTSFWDQVQRTEEILIDITGEATSLLRAPGGTHTNFDAFYFYYLEQAGYQIYDWNVDSGDSRSRQVTAEQIIQTVQQSPLKDEVHVLLHDGAGHEESVKALPSIIEWYRQQGYQFKALTPDVEPAQFRIGNIKWNRTMSKVKHQTYLAMVQDYRLLHHPAQQTAGTAAMNEAGEIEEANRSALNRSSIDSIFWSRLIDDIEAWADFVAGPIFQAITVREWAEQLGGRVHWDERRKKAYTVFSGGRIEWDPESKIVRIAAASRTWSVSLPRMEVMDGRLTIAASDLMTMWKTSSAYSTSLTSLFSSFMK